MGRRVDEYKDARRLHGSHLALGLPVGGLRGAERAGEALHQARHVGELARLRETHQAGVNDGPLPTTDSRDESPNTAGQTLAPTLLEWPKRGAEREARTEGLDNHKRSRRRT